MFNIEKDFSKHIGHIKKCCKKYVYDDQECDLLYSECLEKIWINRNKFTGGEKDFLAWVSVVVKNTFFNYYKREKRYDAEDIDEMLYALEIEDNYSVSNDIDNKKRIEDILYTVEGRFSQKAFEIFKLKFIDDLKDEDVANKLLIPDGTVKSTINRIRQYISVEANIISRPIIVPTTKERRTPLIVPLYIKSRFVKKINRIISRYIKAVELKTA